MIFGSSLIGQVVTFMRKLQNLHTHTCYCDGKDSPEEIVLTAIDKGFASIGFSGHSYMHYAPDHSMSIDGTEEYKNEITLLKEKYQNKIDIFCGLEVDMYSEIDLTGYDYLIGSVHYLLCDGKYVGFDRSAEVVKGVIDEHFAGSGIEYAKAYYKALGKLPQYGDFDIIGHFDLITKHCDNVEFFDQNSAEYKNAAIEAVQALEGKIPFFEVNTGAIARGYRKKPYPENFLLKELKKHGFGAVITSDCHDRKMLDCKFEYAAELLKQCGFKERYVLTKQGFKPVSL